MELEEAIKRCQKLVTTKFNNDYSIDGMDKEAIEKLLKAVEKLQKDMTFIIHQTKNNKQFQCNCIYEQGEFNEN